MAKKVKKKKVVMNKHHLIYKSDKNKEVVRNIRKGVHLAIRYIRFFNYLTEQEADTIITEVMLKRKYDE